MRFRSSTSPPPFDVRVQRRLLGLVALLAVVIVAMMALRSPKPSTPPDGAAASSAQDSSPTPAPRVDLDGSTPTAEFGEPPTAAERPRQSRRRAAEPPSSAPAALDKTGLAGVRDNTLGIRHDEADVFYEILDHARRVPAAELERASRADVLYVNLMADPQQHRGDVVTVVGELRGLYEFAAGDNPYGFKRLYEAWIITPEAPDRPYRVVASAADGLPLGERRTPVRVTGYFFKREGYQSQSGLQVAPTLLARQIAPDGSVRKPAPDGMATLMVGVAVGLGLVLLATLFAFAWSDRRVVRRNDLLPPFSREMARSFQVTDQRSVSESLHELAVRELYGEPEPPPSGSAAASRPRDEAPVELPTPPPPTRS